MIWVDKTRRIGAAIRLTLPVSGQDDKGERDRGTWKYCW